MFDTALQIIAPHHCYGCDKIGSPLCADCKYDISIEPFTGCVVCARPAGPRGICSQCQVPYQRAWCVGERSEVLQKTIDGFKFERLKAAHRSLGDLLDETLPVLPADTVIVPVPTIAAHIRQRGYDHAALLARYLAKRRGLPYHSVLGRANSTRQRGASRKQRIVQAKSAFKSNGPVENRTYLLVDDVATTGATLHYAAKTLKDAGAEQVFVAVLAKQPLDHTEVI